jgi:hypothetical protein
VSRDLQLNCVINFFFRLHLVLHAYAVRFDVTGTVTLFGFTFWLGTQLNRLSIGHANTAGHGYTAGMEWTGG